MIRCSGPDSGPIPRRSTLSVTCDGEHHGKPPVFASEIDAPEFYRLAIANGWLMNNDQHLCPACRRRARR